MDGTIDLELLERFVAVAEAASFSGAARRLGLPKSSVSRAVARLEAELDAELLHRTTRQVALSTAGAALYERCAPLIASLRQAVGSLPEREEHPSGELKLTAPVDLGAAFLADLVARFVARYPAVRVDVELTARTVDLVAEGFDAALRASTRPLADSSLKALRLSTVELHLYASPAYLARRGTPRSARELDGHDWVLHRGARPPLRLEGPGRPTVQAHPRVRSDDFFFLREQLRAGVGLGLLPSFLAGGDLDGGRLVRLLPRYAMSGGSLWLLHPATRRPPRKLTAFRDFLVESLAARPLGSR